MAFLNELETICLSQAICGYSSMLSVSNALIKSRGPSLFSNYLRENNIKLESKALIVTS